MTRILTCISLLLASCDAVAQTPVVSPTPPPLPDEPLTIRDASVGYIDSASIADQMRIRSDRGSGFKFPNRSEFFYARSRPFGPGLPLPEKSVDFQDHTLYLEKMIAPEWSVFAEGGLRYLNPQVNANTAGIGDMNLGFKYVFLNDADQIWTFQLRTYVPTGDADRGLGNLHTSLEPAILGFTRLSEDLGLASEFRYWQPLGGTEFAGGILRYGLGLRYNLLQGEQWRLSPTAEAIGWTVLGGKESRQLDDGTVIQNNAAGETIVNLKLGARLDLNERAGFYAGYGRAVTGNQWYRDVVRIEFRWLY